MIDVIEILQHWHAGRPRTLPTDVSTRSGGWTTNSSATAAASTSRCTGSACCSLLAANASSVTAPRGCCSACSAGDPNNEILGAWLAKESVRDTLDADTVTDAAVLLDKTISGCLADRVGEIRALGKILQRWRGEILAHHGTAASNGPTEGLNLVVEESSAAGDASRTSSTTGFACSWTPADQHGPPTITTDPQHPTSPPSRVEPLKNPFRTLAHDDLIDGTSPRSTSRHADTSSQIPNTEGDEEEPSCAERSSP
jgi:hypothetical protein